MAKRSFIDSFASTLGLFPARRRYIQIESKKFDPGSNKSDRDAMRADFQAVGDDLRLAIYQYGEKTN